MLNYLQGHPHGNLQYSDIRVYCWRLWSELGWAGDSYESYSHTKSNWGQESKWDDPEYHALGVKLKFNSMVVYGDQSETIFMWCSVAMKDSLEINRREINPKVEISKVEMAEKKEGNSER